MAARERELKNQLVKYKRLYRATGEANKRLEAVNKDLMGRLSVAEANLGNCQQALDMNKQLLRQMAEGHNAKEQGLVELLNKLKAKLREMGYHGDFDRLG